LNYTQLSAANPKIVLAEDEVICPWRGSRFNVKTGAVLTPPAQRNVKSFPVRIVGTDVEVEIEEDDRSERRGATFGA
jgi:nitrite reductase/ring-hydroxylating ferredoxin subunit